MKVWNRKISALEIKEQKQELITTDKCFTLALIYFLPNQKKKKHVHRIIDEVFFILSGKIDFYVNGRRFILSEGQMIHIEPGDIHYKENIYKERVAMLLIKTKLDICDYTDLE